MKANYHTHSEYCGHAEGTLEDYIEKACSFHMDSLGFAEHGPFPGNPFGMRMDFNTLPDYVNELKSLKEKYKNKKDEASMMAQNQEIQAVYAKYGVSPTGSCGYLLIQMPILFALYRVIYAIPAYVGKVKEAFFPLVDKIIETEGASELIRNFTNSAMYAKQFTNDSFVAGETAYIQNTLIDCLNKASTAEFLTISENFPKLTEDVNKTLEQLDVYNNFFGHSCISINTDING